MATNLLTRTLADPTLAVFIVFGPSQLPVSQSLSLKLPGPYLRIKGELLVKSLPAHVRVSITRVWIGNVQGENTR